ncbi:hypothetical protein [Aquimarina mytili]|uniref:Uncharacterized protein n=1 Tax=Aquimarina mytili TaxID=874423 RepID=A0A937D4B7_9FLAO|nr:hypothetical protein [Aquimarina mytili]MBL0682014.1 hypothetical protein [Aquimarina mytili]
MYRIALIIFLVFSTPTINYSQGKLEKAEESLSKKEHQRSGNRSRSRSTNSNDSEDYQDNFLVEELGFLLVEACLYSTYYIAIESPMEKEFRGSTAAITKYPYLNANKGNYAYERGEDTGLFRTSFSNRFIIENPKITGNHFNLDIRFLRRMGFEADYLQLWEENTNFGNNSLAIFTFMAKYHRIRTEKFNAWWGLGTTYIAREVEELGFAYGLGAEFFFTKPFSLETNFNQTFINKETVNKFNILLNYHVNRYKISGGYEHLKIGHPNFSTFSVGLGISF